jgi:hypothetical protein
MNNELVLVQSISIANRVLPLSIRIKNEILRSPSPAAYLGQELLFQL